MAQQTNQKKAARVLLRRGAPILAAVLGVSMGWAGGSARADNGQAIILGVLCGATTANCETNPTDVLNNGSGNAFDGIASNGPAGLYGVNDSNAAAVGAETAGVYGLGNGPGDDGVYGLSFDAAASGVHGDNSGGGNGVYGHADSSAASGVYGQNDGTGFGVAGRASSGTGVLGDSANGVGVVANSANGTALQVTGKAQFSRSGLATVAGSAAAPKNSVRVSLPITAKSMMTATLQKFVAGVYVVAAVPNVSGGYFTIYLNKAVTTSVGPIAWIVTETP